MLVRDGPHAAAPMEVLMVRRNLNSDFVGGAYVFPGGAVDPADGGPEAESCCGGRTDAEASEILGLPSGGLAYWVAVLRECFEEAGVLLAHGGEGGGGPVDPADRALLSLADPADAARFARHRAAVNRGERRFLDVCREEGLALAVERVHYFAHWITPEGAPRRYDTRFFVAATAPEQVPLHDEGETIAAQWIRPADALRRHRDGEIELIFPTIRNLQAIGRFGTSAELLAAAAAAGQVPAILPRIAVDGKAVRILLPGDEGYEAAAPGAAGSGGQGGGGEGGAAGSVAAGGGPGGGVAIDRQGDDSGGAAPFDFNRAVRAISHAANQEPAEQPAAPSPERERPGP
jgi:8-oxo-dGTP pyrophosphatase MutT (NUDIX family)